MHVSVTHKGQAHHIEITPTTTPADIKSQLEAATGVPAHAQKLLHKALSPAADNAEPLVVLFGRAHISMDDIPAQKILMIGSSAADIDAVRRKDNVLAIRKQRETAPSKPTKIVQQPDRKYTFGSVQPLPNFADADQARKMLIRLREDIGIIEVMRTHAWYVDTLTELHPAERTILGFNKNKGQEISIRIRTDRLDGFRHYRTVVKVLLHELVHMVHSDHDDAFNTLNSQLNREYDRYSIGHNAAGALVDGSREFSTGDTEADSARVGYQAGAFVLGGDASSASVSSVSGPSTSPSREILASAAQRRIEKWEQDLIDSCDEQHGGKINLK